jgi:hypothetical protein
MPRCKSKRNTSYRQRYNALSALEVHTIGKIQHLFTLCILQLKVAEQLFAFFVMLEFDDDEELMMMMLIHVHHCLNVVRFLSLLDNLLMEITPDQVIPRLVPAVMLLFCFMFCMKHIRRSTSCLIARLMKYFISS